MNNMLILLIISIISNVIVSDIPFKINKYTSKYKFMKLILGIIYKVFTCAPCMSYHLTWLYYLIVLETPIGFLYGFITYLMAAIVDKIMHTTTLY